MSTLTVIEHWGAGTASAAVVGPRGRNEEHGPVDTPLPLASVTKPLFAYAVLVAVEEGSLALDQPAGPPGSTVRHLLSHSSGLGPDGGVFGPPGRSRIYSNAGFDELGALLQLQTGLAPAAYLHEAVLLPLSMRATDLRG
ncbi:MAG TPA: serine hydrolase domain-containing protein, partial [Acidimicrobiales bacterium]